jgi:hypothetical protein
MTKQAAGFHPRKAWIESGIDSAAACRLNKARNFLLRGASRFVAAPSPLDGATR